MKLTGLRIPFRKSLNEVVASFDEKFPEKTRLLNNFTLCRNSHNIQINLTLHSTEHVSLKVFNLSGQQVASILNSTLRMGTHKIQWNTQSVAPGCYAIKMNTSSGTCVKHVPFFGK
ncbi:MAG: T9SS type A sorting domain-containing protein [Fibrobacter sp.]|nr:T9SS type A sorting domain-containing protein [Fibrobacter sp.]